MMAMKIIFFKF